MLARGGNGAFFLLFSLSWFIHMMGSEAGLVLLDWALDGHAGNIVWPASAVYPIYYWTRPGVKDAEVSEWDLLYENGHWVGQDQWGGTPEGVRQRRSRNRDRIGGRVRDRGRLEK